MNDELEFFNTDSPTKESYVDEAHAKLACMLNTCLVEFFFFFFLYRILWTAVVSGMPAKKADGRRLEMATKLFTFHRVNNKRKTWKNTKKKNVFKPQLFQEKCLGLAN